MTKHSSMQYHIRQNSCPLGVFMLSEKKNEKFLLLWSTKSPTILLVVMFHHLDCLLLLHRFPAFSKTAPLGLTSTSWWLAYCYWNKTQWVDLYQVSEEKSYVCIGDSWGSIQLSHSCLLLLHLCFHLQLGLTINHHADQSLNSFCQWQSGLVGKSGKRHDHAVLLTGLDICSWKNEPCDTLGNWLKVMLCGNILYGSTCCQWRKLSLLKEARECRWTAGGGLDRWKWRWCITVLSGAKWFFIYSLVEVLYEW